MRKNAERKRQNRKQEKEILKQDTPAAEEHRQQRRDGLKGFVLLVLGIFLLAAWAGLSTGTVGSGADRIMSYGFGIFAFALPLLFLAVGLGYLVLRRNIVRTLRFWMVVLFFLSLMGLIHLLLIPAGEELAPDSLLAGCGLAGGLLAFFLDRFLGATGSGIALLALMVVSFLVAARLSLTGMAGSLVERVKAFFYRRRGRQRLEAMQKERDGETEEKLEIPFRKPSRPRPEPVRKEPIRETAPSVTETQQLGTGETNTMEAYRKEEFSAFTQGLRKESPFKRIFRSSGGKDEESLEQYLSAPREACENNRRTLQEEELWSGSAVGPDGNLRYSEPRKPGQPVRDDLRRTVVATGGRPAATAGETSGTGYQGGIGNPHTGAGNGTGTDTPRTSADGGTWFGTYRPEEPAELPEGMARVENAEEQPADIRLVINDYTKNQEPLVYEVPADTADSAAGGIPDGQPGADDTDADDTDSRPDGAGTEDGAQGMEPGWAASVLASVQKERAEADGNEAAPSVPVQETADGGNDPAGVVDAVVTPAPEKPAIVDSLEAARSAEAMEQQGGAAATAVQEPPAPKAPTYQLPPLDLLEEPVQRDRSNDDAEIMNQCAILEQTLADFKVNAKVVAVTRGPSVTRFELEPAPGVKVSSVVNLADDIALRLAAPGVRIEAPIPGKAAIGIEAPNTTNEPVNFREVVDNKAIRENPSKLCVGLGRDISGNVISIDLSKMPHLLVAGSTGSGKSVCINTLLTGILYKALPEEVKLILVDPKVVELTNYNGIPHLLVPVVTDAKKAASALHWAVSEMERRYKVFADTRVREIKSYNAQAEEKMPYIVIVIDEMSDLMMVAKADVEDAILRLAQKARAAGIHLVLATQRPSVDVITGIVKANIPSRIAFAVSSQTDSRTILDMGGAEKLLGKGDMLFYPTGTNKPLRVQGAFVSDAEINGVVDFIKDQAIPVEYSEEVTSQALPSDAGSSGGAGATGGQDEMDELFEDAVSMVLDVGQASSSMLQRRFRIGYTRAARLVDTMEELGIVGPAVGSKPRELLMTRQEAEAAFLNRE